MEPMKASEVIGELRRAARMYEVLKRAEEMVSVLANLEGTERQIKANIVEGEKLLKSLEDKAIEVCKKVQEATKSGFEQFAQDMEVLKSRLDALETQNAERE